MTNYNLYILDSCKSTQEEVKYFLSSQGQEKFVAFLASEQTQGKGSYSREWVSEKGGLYLSFNYPFFKNLIPSSIIFSLIAIKSLKDYLLQQKIVLDNIGLIYPNDMVLKFNKDYYKVGGVLVETYKNFYIVGIGINVNNSVLNYKFEHRAISLKEYFLLYENISKEFDVVEIGKKILHNVASFKYDQEELFKELEKFDFSSEIQNVEVLLFWDGEKKDKFDKIKIDYLNNKIVLYKGRMRKELKFEKIFRIMY
ncbi:MAG: hypothetical protein ACK4GJ_03150 [bacterium]